MAHWLSLVALYLISVISIGNHQREDLQYDETSRHVWFGWSVNLKPMANRGSKKPTQDIGTTKYKDVDRQIEADSL